MIPVLFIIGFTTLFGQVVLLRELNVAFYGVELIYLLALGFWLFLTALGALLSRRIIAPSPGRIFALPLVFSVSLPVSIAMIRAGRILFSGVPGAYLPFFEQLLAMALALLPAGLLSGLMFQWAAGHYAGEGGTLAAAYGVECAGGLAGGVFATACLLWGVQNFAAAVTCCMLTVSAMGVIMPKGRYRFLCCASFIMAALFIIALLTAPEADRLMNSWNHPGIVVSSDTPYGRLTVTQTAGQISVFDNDALVFETQGNEAELFANLVMLQHPDPKSILALGGGFDGTVRELLKHHPERIDAVELNQAMVKHVLPHLPTDIGRSLANPAVRLTVADPRKFLSSCDLYDVILVGMPDPSSGQTNRYYTREFFSMCSAKLKPGGILGFRLHSAENYWTPQLTRRTASIYRSLVSVFPDTSVLPGATNVITASHKPLPHSPESVERRFKERGIDTRMLSPPYIKYLYLNDRYREIEGTLKTAVSVANTDINPVCYRYALMIWLSKFFPALAVVDFSAAGNENIFTGVWAWALWAMLALVFFFVRRRLKIHRYLLVFTAGMLGTIAESVFLLHYQMKEGVLFQDIGLLITIFMAGLALGSLSVGRFTAGISRHEGRKRLWGIGLLSGFCLLTLAAFIMIRVGMAGIVETGGILLAAGFLVSGIFAYAGTVDVERQDVLVSPLYAADIIGACLGSLAAGLVLIPVMGLAATAGLMLILAASAMLLV